MLGAKTEKTATNWSIDGRSERQKKKLCKLWRFDVSSVVWDVWRWLWWFGLVKKAVEGVVLMFSRGFSSKSKFVFEMFKMFWDHKNGFLDDWWPFWLLASHLQLVRIVFRKRSITQLQVLVALWISSFLMLTPSRLNFQTFFVVGFPAEKY